MTIRKYASAQIMDVVKGSWLQRLAHRHDFTHEVRSGYIYVRSRAVSSRTNDNFDTFLPSELRTNYATFIGRPAFVNHHNAELRRFRGVNIDAALHEDHAPDGSPDVWIETLMEIDAKAYPMLAEEVLAQNIQRTSMGANVSSSECSVCGNRAATVDSYCAHVVSQKGSRVRRLNASTGGYEDVLVHENLYGVNFFENSLLVEDPADQTAYLYGIDDRGLSMHASRSGQSAPSRVNMLHQDACPVCDSYEWTDAGQCSTCGYEIPPEPFQDPDLDVADRVNRDGSWFSPDLAAAPPFAP